MSCYRNIITRAFISLLFVFSFSLFNISFAQDGEALFKANCASCHRPLEDFTGPALKGARDREPSKDWVYKWVYNTNSMVNSDPYAMALKARFQSVMTQQSEANLSKKDVEAILDWADKYEKPAPTKTPNGGTGEDNSLLYGILTIILAVIAFILLQVNSSLRKLSDEKEGIRRSEPVPFYRNKTYLMAGILVLFLIGGYFVIDAAIGLGRQQNYQPEQPIYYSHQVHAGVNQISCLYCHTNAQYSKTAGIPSVNVCMNCHKGIKEYTGEPILREDGSQVDATGEIQKLYEYAGWNPVKKVYDKPGKPIQWVKIHNLPDHVYFNHSQHVMVGKQQCQTCHGPIQDMPQVYQFSPLSMGWCINCHRTTKVDFYNKETGEGNKFYSIYEKFHNDIKSGKIDSVTVEKIGGTECQKCHY
ncbi:c-type cytochrome [Ferruginibacter albus]|uniref:c-type cytochrome n=1 Tax=Ferruginibacter albus TaxID=2875540 RepID=UPI001CC6CBC5|nr:c-type cytochrome [Ferruginibacter albus]UAY52167.1 c-type cytochrome [Ferruginibacter albus]